jgi:hypothetical protein
MKMTFGKVKKTLSILLAVFFLVAITAGAASAGMWDKYKDPKSKDAGVKSIINVGNGAPGGDGGYATGGKIVVAPHNTASNYAPFTATSWAPSKVSSNVPIFAFSANPFVAASKAKAEADPEKLDADSSAEIKDVDADSSAEVKDVDVDSQAENDVDSSAEIKDVDVDQDADADQDVSLEDVYAYGGEANGGNGGEGGDDNVVNVGFIGNNEDWDGAVGVDNTNEAEDDGTITNA